VRDFFATILALVIIVCTIWGVIALLAAGVSVVSSLGIPQGLLYFCAGICFAVSYKNIGHWFADYCDTVWNKVSSWIVQR
jgi:hypothetical protein